MAKSGLMAALRRAYGIAKKSMATGIPAGELLDMSRKALDTPLSRRRLLQGSLAAASALAAATWTREGHKAVAQQTGRSPILIVGAGIAGLTAAYRLRLGGVRADIIDATNRPGGRIRTQPKVAATPIFAELGGEFIDTNHTSLLGLASELGLRAIDLTVAQRGLVEDTFFFQGRRLRFEEVVADFAPLAERIDADLAAIGDVLSYQEFNQTAEQLDFTSIAEYLDQAQVSASLNQLLRVAYTTEYGRDADEQSSLNLLYLIGTNPNTFEFYGDSDERYQIDGGNNQITDRLAAAVADSLEMGTALEAINGLPDGRYRVTLRTGQSVFDRVYERIVLTLPFTLLREVQLNVDLPPEKRRAINRLGYGTNAKLITGHRNRIWREAYRSTAAVFTDLGFQNTWEATPFAPSGNGLVTDFTGGRQGLSVGAGTPEDQAQRFLAQFERVFPGVQGTRQGRAVRAFWPGERFFRGSYSCYLIGQWTQFYQLEGERVGNLYFAGEHTSTESQGYMEGGCETGERAAIEILQDLGLIAPAQALEAQRIQRQASRSSRRLPKRKNSRKGR